MLMEQQRLEREKQMRQIMNNPVVFKINTPKSIPKVNNNKVLNKDDDGVIDLGCCLCACFPINKN